MHFHNSAHFVYCFEKLKEPQTVFHPAYDLLTEKNLDRLLSHVVQKFMKIMIIFPAYLKHMVKKSHDSVTISGNLNIVEFFSIRLDEHDSSVCILMVRQSNITNQRDIIK